MPRVKSATPPWGRWEILLAEPSYQVKRITVQPGKRLSYQRHFKRQEHWFVVQGEALATLEGRGIALKVGDALDIPVEAAHRIANAGKNDMVFIEVQRGSYFGEDDILRLEDDYGRAKK